MATRVWTRQINPLGFLYGTTQATGAVPYRTSDGHPRASFPYATGGAVIVPVGLLAEYLAVADLKVRLLFHCAGTGYSLSGGSLRFAARRAGQAGFGWTFNTTEVDLAVAMGSVANALLEVELTVPVGEARDNAVEGDWLFMRLAVGTTLFGDPPAPPEPATMLAMAEIFQEIG